VIWIRDVAFGDVIGYWCIGIFGKRNKIRSADRHWALGILCAFGAAIAEWRTYLQKFALQSNAYQKFSFLISHFSLKIYALHTTHHALKKGSFNA